MPIVREQVVAAIEAALAGVDVAELETMPAGDPVKFPALHIFDAGQNPLNDTEAGVTRYDLALTLEGYMEQAGGAAAYARLNALYRDVVAALMVEPLLGGLAETIDEGALRLSVAPLAAKPRLGFALDMIITFPARRDDPAQAA